MTPTPRVPYEAAEIARRFTAWASLPTQSDRCLMLRNDAWNAYCDARDGLPEGTSAGRSLFGRRDADPAQIRMFS